MSGGQFPLTIQQGCTFKLLLEWTDDTPAETPIDLTGYSAKGQLRRRAIASEPPIDFYIFFHPDRTTGKFMVLLSGLQTSQLIPGEYSYDIILISPTNEKEPFLSGIATIEAVSTKLDQAILGELWIDTPSILWGAAA